MGKTSFVCLLRLRLMEFIIQVKLSSSQSRTVGHQCIDKAHTPLFCLQELFFFCLLFTSWTTFIQLNSESRDPNHCPHSNTPAQQTPKSPNSPFWESFWVSCSLMSRQLEVVSGFTQSLPGVEGGGVGGSPAERGRAWQTLHTLLLSAAPGASKPCSTTNPLPYPHFPPPNKWAVTWRDEMCLFSPSDLDTFIFRCYLFMQSHSNFLHTKSQHLLNMGHHLGMFLWWFACP